MNRFKWSSLFVVGALMLSGVGAGWAAEKTVSNAMATAGGGEKIDINTATEAQLMTLPGIAEGLAAKIIAGRPYVKKNDLVLKKVIPSATYKKISEAIIAKQ